MLEVKNLCKAYPSFTVRDVSFNLPEGYILGFIGVNGAGKTTTIKSILNLVRPDSGQVKVLGKDMFSHEMELKQQIGLMLGPVGFYAKSKVSRIIDVYKRFFDEWNDGIFRDLLKRFRIDYNKKICELSTGMKVKLGIAMALSHNAKLIILDEPTSGLDPVARNELLSLFQEIVENGERSILFSTHITSDLDKCADYIVFIKDGQLVANDTKDNLIYRHLLIAGKKDDLTPHLRARLIGVKTNSYGFSGLILREHFNENSDIRFETPNLEDLMVYYNAEVRI